MYHDQHIVLADTSEQVDGQLSLIDILRNQNNVTEIPLGIYSINDINGHSLDSIKGTKLAFSNLTDYVGKTVLRVFSKFSPDKCEVCKILRVEDYYGHLQCTVQFREDGAYDFISASFIDNIEEIYDFK